MLASTRLFPVLLPVLATSISSGQNHRDWTANGIWMYLTSMSSEQHHLGWTDQTSMAALVRWLPMLWAALAKSVFSRQNAHDFSTQSSTISSTRSHPMLLSVLAKSMSPDRTIATGQASAVGVYLHDYFQCYDQRLRKMCSPDRTLLNVQARATQSFSVLAKHVFSGQNHRDWTGQRSMVVLTWPLSILWWALARSVFSRPNARDFSGQSSTMWLHDYFQYHCQCLRNICPPDRTIASGEAGRVWLYLHDYFQYYEQRLRKVCSPTRLLPILLSMLAKYMSSGQNHREWRAWRSMVEITWLLSILWSALAKSVRWTSSLAKALLQVVCSILI